MKTLDLSNPVKNLADNEIKDDSGISLTFGHLLAQSLITSNGKPGDPIKFFDWALTLYKEGKILVDDSDLNILKDFVDKNETLTCLVKGPILKEISKAKG
jgi:hypothetical protein